MSRRLEWLFAAALGVAGAAQAQPSLQARAGVPAKAAPSLNPAAFEGIGRTATPMEVAAWDIDVRPDFKGLPKGSGTVAKGMQVWEAKCASCHGVFGESNEVFAPIVGGTNKDDIRTGRAARLNDNSFPGRTTLMKVSTLSTLWDYINRAMPWTQPKSLTPDEVYAVTAYILNLGGVIGDDDTLSDRNIGEAQKLLPNRNGMTTEHALWPGPEFGRHVPEVKATACMRNCPVDAQLTSSLPDFARNAHGNLAQQNRIVGAQRGADTTRPPGTVAAAAVVAAIVPPPAALEAPAKPAPATTSTATATAAAAAVTALLQKYTCTACHGMDSKIVGPGLREIARKYEGRPDAVAYLSGKIKAGGSGVWGAVPMPPQSLSEGEARLISDWLAAGADK